jgi:hypothetical protein
MMDGMEGKWSVAIVDVKQPQATIESKGSLGGWSGERRLIANR